MHFNFTDFYHSQPQLIGQVNYFVPVPWQVKVGCSADGAQFWLGVEVCSVGKICGWTTKA